ncbi:hypothetical protein [Marinicella rhabdoformis]|uniref:hypothetical protein n=1 Tax=Marinicella rhabdoformis TaxID=2580566 RepID=UPI0012AECF82|nr:hypothetical protein [Marinicella rhabdoformis]
MKKEDFLSKIDNHVTKAADLIEGDGGYNIKRGMSHVVSGYVEDLFALFLAKYIGDQSIEYHVDKVTSIRFAPEEKAKSFKPDLSMIKDTTMTHYFDLKTNLGWNRTFVDYLKEKSKFIESLRGKPAWIYFSDNKTVNHIKISSNLRFQMVVIYGGNINPKLLKENLEKAIEIPYVDVYILNKVAASNKGYVINHHDFDKLLETVKS